MKNFFDLDKTILASIQLVPFDRFKTCSSIPRYPDCRSLTIVASTLTPEIYERSLIVFISHRWLRTERSSDGWDESIGAHPDNSDGTKFSLIVEGIEKMIRFMTTDLTDTECYLWIDYSCTDQDKYAPDEVLGSLETIMTISDVIFSPIIDPHWKRRSPEDWQNFDQNPSYDYPSEAWVGSSSSYVSRGWCRLEMLLASFLPSLQQPTTRIDRFRGKLLYFKECGKRPHFIYGSREKDETAKHTNRHHNHQHLPLPLPPLTTSSVQQYNPIDGHVTRRRDKKRIFDIFEHLKPLIVQRREGYEGEINSDGLPHGSGRYVYDQDKSYEGEWKDSMKHGQGKLITFHYTSGFVYKGGFEGGKMQGHGRYLSAAGDIHEGEYHNNILHGHAIVYYSNGDVFDGLYENGKKQGEGKFFCRNGDIYEGEFHLNKREGRGVFTLNGGKERYEGDFHHDRMHGFGVYQYSNGDYYEGEWKRGRKQGQGKYYSFNGDVYEGEFSEDRKHGYGVYRYVDGKSVYEGYWANDMKNGQGKMTWEGVEVYEGEWHDDQHTEKGKWKKHWHLLTKPR